MCYSTGSGRLLWHKGCQSGSELGLGDAVEPTLLVIGLNSRTAPAAVRERFWISETRRYEALGGTGAGGRGRRGHYPCHRRSHGIHRLGKRFFAGGKLGPALPLEQVRPETLRMETLLPSSSMTPLCFTFSP